MNLALKRTIVYAIIIGNLVFYLVPIVPTRVSPTFLLPERNYCGSRPVILPSDYVLVFSSISFVTTGIAARMPLGYGLVGLVVVPNWGWNTIQFPPLGYATCMPIGY